MLTENLQVVDSNRELSSKGIKASKDL